MTTQNTQTEPALAFDEDSLRQAFEKSNPELIAIEPENAAEAATPETEPKPETETVETEPESAESEPSGDLGTDIEAATKAKEEETASAKLAADEAAKKTAAPVAPVHPDLEDISKNLDPHTKPKTRKIIEQFKTTAIKERERAANLEREQTALKQQLAELDTQLKSGKPPKAMEDELATLRERIRELDASKDPAIEAKYDKPIASNTEAAINMLGEYGLFKVATFDKEGKPTGEFRDMTDKEKGQLTAQLKNNGISLRTMAGHIKRLESAGDPDSLVGAEQLRELARENDRLAREKNTELTQIKGNFEGRAQARTQEQQAQQAQIDKIVQTTSEESLKADMAEIAKSFPAINPPPEPLATDSAAVVASKKSAIAEFQSAVKGIEEAVKVFNGHGLPADKAAQARGKMAAAAVQAVILKTHILPKMVKEAAARDTRIKDLEAQVAKFRGAGSLNRAHSAAITAGANGKEVANVPANASFADMAREAFKSRGVDVTT